MAENAGNKWKLLGKGGMAENIIKIWANLNDFCVCQN